MRLCEPEEEKEKTGEESLCLETLPIDGRLLIFEFLPHNDLCTMRKVSPWTKTLIDIYRQTMRKRRIDYVSIMNTSPQVLDVVVNSLEEERILFFSFDNGICQLAKAFHHDHFGRQNEIFDFVAYEPLREHPFHLKEYASFVGLGLKDALNKALKGSRIHELKLKKMGEDFTDDFVSTLKDIFTGRVNMISEVSCHYNNLTKPRHHQFYFEIGAKRLDVEIPRLSKSLHDADFLKRACKLTSLTIVEGGHIRQSNILSEENSLMNVVNVPVLSIQGALASIKELQTFVQARSHLTSGRCSFFFFKDEAIANLIRKDLNDLKHCVSHCPNHPVFNILKPPRNYEYAFEFSTCSK